jgi:hypothetical protein
VVEVVGVETQTQVTTEAQVVEVVEIQETSPQVELATKEVLVEITLQLLHSQQEVEVAQRLLEPTVLQAQVEMVAQEHQTQSLARL